jgi:hypothetical protein
MKPSPPPHVPGQVLLFSGHMVDSPTRAKPRFPPAAVPHAAADIAHMLATLQAGPHDLALTQGSSGGDLLFAEACQARGVPVRLMQAVPEPRFTQESLLPSADGEQWRQRYLAVKARLAAPPEVLPSGAASTDQDADVYVRCNQWLLDTALALAAKAGPDAMHFICLWDGGGGDGPGGTAHMVQAVQQQHGQVHPIKPRF